MTEIYMHQYTAIIEKCSQTGLYVGYVPGFPGAHSQATSVEDLTHQLEEVISMLLDEGEPHMEGEFVGTFNLTLPNHHG